MSLNDFLYRLSGRTKADHAGMLFTLYRHYVEHSRSKETFDAFIFWGEMLINDFNEVDKYLIDPQKLFRNLTDLRQLEDDYSYLSPNQIEAIRSFWSTFQVKTEGRNERNFCALWQILYELYLRLRKSLDADGLAYEGMAYRLAADKANTLTPQTIGYDELVFIGLYGLTPSERKLVDTFTQAGFACEIADDGDDVPPSEQQCSIEVVGVPSGIGQAKYMHTLLSQWAAKELVEGEAALRTAVILPDETLLVPLLNAIPETVPCINVTMGYPLSATPVATLVNAILTLHRNARRTPAGLPTYYYQDVQTVLNHPYLRTAEPQAATNIIADITKGNKVQVPASLLTVTPLLERLFAPVADVSRWSAHIASILALLENAQAVPAGEDAEAVHSYYKGVTRLGDLISRAGLEIQPETYGRLLRRIVDHVKIPFQGEPLAGLQIMGFLETRALTFDRLAILSMNEGTFPPRNADNTFIPYNLRRGFGLPVGEQREQLWRHHFYRLLRHARHVSLVYDTRSGGQHTGEVSRFVHQLRYRHNYSLDSRQVIHPMSIIRLQPLGVEKNADVLRRLDRFLVGEGNSALSASALNLYLDCPLRFYYAVVEGVGEEPSVKESIGSGTFGTILHDTLQQLYEPLIGRTVDAAALHDLSRNRPTIEQAVACAFAKVHFCTPGVLHPLTGQNYLVAQMAGKYAVRLLSEDARLAPFRYLASELRIEAAVPIGGGRKVSFRGYIDRLDTVGEGLRIIDYKSGGSGERIIPSYGALFDPSLRKRPKEAMQALLYAWMIRRQAVPLVPVPPDSPVYTAIYYMRRLFTSPFESALYLRNEQGRGSVPLGDFLSHEASFEEVLRACLDRIYDPAVPFYPTSILDHCLYCPFASVCPPRS
jgi:hypothetical protein